MPDDDPKLDAALAALSGVGQSSATREDDDRWAKRVASRVSTFAPPSRRELDPFLAAPFPDDHQDLDRQDFDQPRGAADDHGHAAVAADFGDAHGWEGSMTEDDSRPPPNSLAALSGLTRSGPSAAPEPMDGAAKGDDSGLIDLRAMSQPEPETAPVEAAAAAAPVAVSEKAAPVSLKSESPAKAAAVSTAPAGAAAVPPSSTTATAASAAAPRAEEKKKGGAVIWIAFGGLAAAAAAAFFVVGPMAKKDEASTASAPAAGQAEKKADDNKVAAAEKPAASGAPEEPPPQATAAPAATEELPHPAAGTPTKPGAGPVATGGSKALVAPDPAAKPTASTTATAEAPKSAGTGSLDEVLGIGKDQPTKKVEAADNLPDKPDSMDVRSAINAKVGSASACVKGLDGPSNVAVTFGPAGAVSGVAVSSGPAKGTGAESCIKNAFSSAKVPPSKKGATGSATLVP